MEGRTPLRPLGIGEILDGAINIVLKHWRTLVKAVLVVVIPLQILSIAILAATIPDADLLNNQGAFSGRDPYGDISGDEIGSLFLGIGLVGLLGFVLTAFATAACFKAVSDAYLGARPDWRESLRFGRQRVPSLLWVTLLVGLGVVLGMLALIIPGIWLYVAWSVAVPALLLEGLRGRKALGRSFGLVKGRWWPTFGALLIGFLLAAVVGGIVGGIVSALAFTGAGDSILGASVLHGVSTGLSQLVTTPVTIAILTVVYFDLRVRKEGADLETLTAPLGISPDPARLPKAARPVAGWQSSGGPPPTAPGWQGAGAPAPQQWQGPPPTAAGWQGPAPSEPWHGSGWQQPEPPGDARPSPQPPPEPPPAEDAGGWAPPRPPGEAGSQPEEPR